MDSLLRLDGNTESASFTPRAGYPEVIAANLRHGLAHSLADRKAFARWLHESEPHLSCWELGRQDGLNHELDKRAMEEDQAERPAGENSRGHRDPVARLVRQVERTYFADQGNRWPAGSPRVRVAPFHAALEVYVAVDRPLVAEALKAFGRVYGTVAGPYLAEEAAR